MWDAVVGVSDSRAERRAQFIVGRVRPVRSLNVALAGQEASRLWYGNWYETAEDWRGRDGIGA